MRSLKIKIKNQKQCVCQKSDVTVNSGNVRENMAEEEVNRGNSFLLFPHYFFQLPKKILIFIYVFCTYVGIGVSVFFPHISLCRSFNLST